MDYYEKHKSYVLATLGEPTMYLKSSGWGNYKFVDNLAACTKAGSKGIARTLREDFQRTWQDEVELAILPLITTYELVDESDKY